MLGFEPRIFCVGRDRSADCATTTAPSRVLCRLVFFSKTKPCSKSLRGFVGFAAGSWWRWTIYFRQELQQKSFCKFLLAINLKKTFMGLRQMMFWWIMLGLPQAKQLSIFSRACSVSTEFERCVEREKSPTPSGVRTHDLLIMKHCATATVQILPRLYRCEDYSYDESMICS